MVVKAPALGNGLSRNPKNTDKPIKDVADTVTECVDLKGQFELTVTQFSTQFKSTHIDLFPMFSTGSTVINGHPYFALKPPPLSSLSCTLWFP